MSTPTIRTSHTAEPPASPLADHAATLHLVSVLATGLPAEIGTPSEPDRYTVPAVFSRRVTGEERARIEDPATARDLAEAAGLAHGLELAVSDRRLLIKNTNLAELTGGLATSLAGMLARLDRDLHTDHDERAAAAEVRDTAERQRFEAVSRAAAEVHFADPADRVGGEQAERST